MFTNKFIVLKFKLLAWFSFELSRVNSNVFVSDKVEDEEVFDGKILQYCSIDKKGKKSLGELEQDFLQALQVILHCISMLYIAVVFSFRHIMILWTKRYKKILNLDLGRLEQLM